MGDVVNLNKYRKRKAKEEAAKRAEANRLKHGRTSADRERLERNKQLLESKLDGARMDMDKDKDKDDRDAVKSETAQDEPEDER